MPWTPDNLSVKGAIASFHQAQETRNTIFDKHSQTIASTTATEALVFPGFLPAPRQFLDSRQFQGARDFRYNVTNNEYELSVVVTRSNWEDDQTGLVNQRFTEAGEVWASFKDSLFSALLAAGNVSGSNGWDGATFHQDSRTIGASAIDNNLADSAPAAPTTTGLTAAELLTNINLVRQAFWSFGDDQGRPFNTVAINRMRVVVHPLQERACYEAMNQTSFTGGSGATNEYGKAMMDGFDVNPFAGTAPTNAELFYSALGSVRKPFIYMERTPLEVIVLASADEVAKNNGVMLLTRQRFILTYGEPRRSILMTVS